MKISIFCLIVLVTWNSPECWAKYINPSGDQADLNSIESLRSDAAAIKQQNIEELSSKSKDIIRIAHQTINGALKNVKLMTKKAIEIITNSTQKMERKGNTIKNETITEIQMASKNLTSTYHTDINEAVNKVKLMTKKAKGIIEKLVTNVGTEGNSVKEKTINDLRQQSTNLTSIFNDNIRNSIQRVKLAIITANNTVVKSIEKLGNLTTEKIQGKADAAKLYVQNRIDDMKQSLDSDLLQKKNKVYDDVVEKVKTAKNELDSHNNELLGELDSKKNEIINEIMENNNSTKFKEELGEIKKKFIEKLNAELEETKKSYLQELKETVTDETAAQVNSSKESFKSEKEKYSILLRGEKETYVNELKDLKTVIEKELKTITCCNSNNNTMTEKAPSGTTVETPKSTTEKVPEVKTEETPTDTTVDTPRSTTEKVPEVKTEETSTDTTVETPKSTTEKVPEVKTEETSTDTTVDTPRSTTEKVPEVKTEETPTDITEETENDNIDDVFDDFFLPEEVSK